MDPWTLGLVAVLVLGLTAIVYGALHDRARNRRARAEMLAPPDRTIPRFAPDAPAPQYLSELQARRAPADATPTALSDSDRQALSNALRSAAVTSVAAGYASRSFITDGASSWAVLDDPVVLVCAERVTSIREVLPVLERSVMSGRALVVVAPAFASEVLATLEVNVIQQKVRLLAVSAGDAEVLSEIAERCGAAALERSDLQAGYAPTERLGHCGRWVSDATRSWVLDPPTSSGREPAGPPTGSGRTTE